MFRIVISCKIVNRSMKFEFIHKISVIQQKFLALYKLLRGPDKTCLGWGLDPGCASLRYDIEPSPITKIIIITTVHAIWSTCRGNWQIYRDIVHQRRFERSRSFPMLRSIKCETSCRPEDDIPLLWSFAVLDSILLSSQSPQHKFINSFPLLRLEPAIDEGHWVL